MLASTSILIVSLLSTFVSANRPVTNQVNPRNAPLRRHASPEFQNHRLQARRFGQNGSKVSRRGPMRMLKQRNNEATLKCLGLHSFALCDGENCTDMGATAAGTACVNNAITWDNQPEENVEKSSSPPASSPSASASASPSPASKSAAPSLKPLTTPKAVVAAVKVDNTSEDEECDTEEISFTSTSSSAPAVKTPIAVVAAVQNDANSSSAAPAATTSSTSTSSSSSEIITGGKATFFYQYGAAGACGLTSPDSSPIVAVQIDRFSAQTPDGNPNKNPLCGKSVEITNTANGKSVTAVVMDACPGCANYNSLDLSTGAFDAIADESTGVIDISWKFV